MITPMTFQDSLNDFIEKEIAAKHLFKALKFDNEERVEFLKNPQVVRSGYILPQSIDDDSNSDEDAFPYIITRISEIENVKNSFESIVTMDIVIGIYNEGTYNSDGKLIDDGCGYRDLWNLVEAIRIALFSKRVLDNKYRIVQDFFKAQFIDEDIYPFWEGYITTKWSVAQPVYRDYPLQKGMNNI